MAVPFITHLRARLHARFHVQLQLDEIPEPAGGGTPVTLEGRIVRAFRTHDGMAVGDLVRFPVRLLADDDVAPFDGVFVRYRELAASRHVEAFLNGHPPAFEIELDEILVIPGPSDVPYMEASRLQYVLELIRQRIRPVR